MLMTLILLAFIAAFIIGLLKAALNDASAILSAGNGNTLADDQKADTEHLKALYGDLEYYKARLDNLEYLQRLTEYEYRLERDTHKQAVMLRKMIALDNQIYTTRKKLERIEEGLP